MEVRRVERFEAFSIMALCRGVSEAFDAVGVEGSTIPVYYRDQG